MTNEAGNPNFNQSVNEELQNLSQRLYHLALEGVRSRQSAAQQGGDDIPTPIQKAFSDYSVL